MRPSRRDIPCPRPAGPVDLGWLFLLPGVVLIAAAVLIAAEDDLYDARFRRDEALAIEARHAERVERYAAYLDAVKRQDPTVVRSLVVGQLNAEPTDMIEARLPGLPVYDSTEVFASLEPPPPAPAHRQRVESVLARWATDDASRVWLLASGALCVFVGMLPPVSRRRGTAVIDEAADQRQDADRAADDEGRSLAGEVDELAEVEGSEEFEESDSDEPVAAADLEEDDEAIEDDEVEDGANQANDIGADADDAGEHADAPEPQA